MCLNIEVEIGVTDKSAFFLATNATRVLFQRETTLLLQETTE